MLRHILKNTTANMGGGNSSGNADGSFSTNISRLMLLLMNTKHERTDFVAPTNCYRWVSELYEMEAHVV
ncbi:hypothetical protein MKW98_016324 [Papaver atlanticum]|uniref:Uncharacterized protein n=1 Tax=Papaver atlanticum TaxID=357466 RepID=A0AAD4XDS2_9MAGN|nr:hypothetical protein MKW98_016324 [Papaver atlanticum]